MAKKNRRLIVIASASALLCGTPVVVSTLASHSLRSELAAAGFSVQSAHVTATGAVSVTGLSRGGLRIGQLTRGPQYSILSSALAQASGYTIENVTLSFNAIKVEVPRVAVTGANFGKDDIATIFAMDKELPNRIRKLNAKSVSIPEVRISASFPELDAITYVMKNVGADDFADGKIARMVVDQTVFTSKGKGMEQTGSMKRTEMRGVDLVQSARIYFETAKADEPLLPLYDGYTSDGMVTSATGELPMIMEFGRNSSNAFRARPLQTISLEAAITEFSAQAKKQKETGGKPAPEQAAKLFTFLREIFSAFEDDGMSAENIRLIMGDKANPKATMVIARADGTYGNSKKSAGFRLSGIEVKAPDITAKVAEYSVEGFSYAPTFQGMQEAIAAGDPEFKSIDPRKLMPKLGTSRLIGFEMDAPDPKAPKGIKPERLKVKLGNFTLAATDQINGIPTKIDVSVGNLAFQLPQTTSDANIQQLKALGYTALDVSARLAANWSEKTGQVNVTELSFGGVDMGTVRVNADIGNIGRDIFEADARAAQVALMGATAKSLVLQVENTGLADRLISMQARAQSRKPEDVRRELSGMAGMVIPTMLGANEQTKALADAVSGFLQRAKTLKIDLKAKNPGGIGLPDIMTVKEPKDALTLVNINAAAGN